MISFIVASSLCPVGKLAYVELLSPGKYDLSRLDVWLVTLLLSERPIVYPSWVLYLRYIYYQGFV